MRIGQDICGLAHQAQRIEPVRQRTDDRVEQPRPIETAEKARHCPWQEDQCLDDAPAYEFDVEQQGQNQPEDKLQDHRGAGPPQGVSKRATEGHVVGQRAEMVEADKAARKRVQQHDIAKGIGNADG